MQFIEVSVKQQNVMVLGSETIFGVYFPSYTVASRINIGNFLQRLEIGVKISICLLGASKGAAKLFGFDDYRLMATPVGFIMANLSYLIYDNIIEMLEWANEVWPYYAFPFQVLLPLAVLIATEIKLHMQKSVQQQKNSG